jgi:hypothetical protein
MSLRYTCRLVRTSDAAAFRRAVEGAARAFGGHIEWGQVGRDDECLRLGSTPTVQTLYLPDGVCDWRVFETISATMNAPLMELRIQEEALWDYSLCLGSKGLDTFSTLPQYWDYPDKPDAEHLRKWAGRPKLLAEVWQVPLERIERYFVNWGMEADPDDSGVFNAVMDGKAYPSDQHPYGECRQMFDFLAALGGAIPDEDHRAVFPKRRE